MKKTWVLCSLLAFFLVPAQTRAFTGVYLGWSDFANAALPLETSADTLGVGILGTTPTRIYFIYNVLGRFVFTKGAVSGNLGWGIDLLVGVGYRFMNPSFKRSGWDIGMDAFFNFVPYFLNSETTFTDTVLYYAVGLGVNVIYKINPYVGVGIRAGLRYIFQVDHLSSRIPGAGGIGFNFGFLLTF
ncbi:MAG: hypothetical protein ACRCY4_02835 [Brevinema sp.]